MFSSDKRCKKSYQIAERWRNLQRMKSFHILAQHQYREKNLQKRSSDPNQRQFPPPAKGILIFHPSKRTGQSYYKSSIGDSHVHTMYRIEKGHHTVTISNTWMGLKVRLFPSSEEYQLLSTSITSWLFLPILQDWKKGCICFPAYLRESSWWKQRKL